MRKIKQIYRSLGEYRKLVSRVVICAGLLASPIALHLINSKSLDTLVDPQTGIEYHYALADRPDGSREFYIDSRRDPLVDHVKIIDEGSDVDVDYEQPLLSQFRINLDLSNNPNRKKKFQRLYELALDDSK